MSLSRHAIADWDGNPAPEAPLLPESLKESGLTLGFIQFPLGGFVVEIDDEADFRHRQTGFGRIRC